ncbi:hypothetical protein F5882DRAFT_471336 [Hyaloscypha sp. PMI_1271]|nr:hypothetical protein F5882DRAFT_471336 [Hyaloscypha sp. PMI_1271]
MGCTVEIEELRRLFNGVFGYAAWPYKIPSLDSQRALGVCVAKFIESFGGEDNLIIVYYGGHGGLNVTSKSPCTWAALIQGGPTVDWSIIQPLFFGAGCDVAIFLDCCFAGQAARSYNSHSIEFLAATDKDQMTPSGSKTWPSFTKVLMREMEKMMIQEAYITLPELARRLVEATPPQADNMLPYLSNEGQIEVARLLRALKTALSDPSSPQLTNAEATKIISDVQQKSLDLVNFVSDSLSHLESGQLDKMKSHTTSGTEALKDRIAMRLTLLGEGVHSNNIRVSFDNPSKQDQRLREGKTNGVPVLVEYYYPQIEDKKSWADLSRQVARVSALQSEPKGGNFRILPGLGFLSESLLVPRFGFVFELPENRVGYKYLFPSDLLDQVKVVPLNIRARTASALCDAVIPLHSVGWYHKGIKIENVIIFESPARCNSERSIFDHIQDPEKLLSFLLRVADEKVSHAAGTEYAEGVSCYLNSKGWKQYEDWQFQNLVRDKVLRPLRALSGDHIQEPRFNCF